MVPIKFEKFIDPKTKSSRIRYVGVNTESYEVAVKYMIKLKEEDLQDEKKLRHLAKTAKMKPEDFKLYFSHAIL